MHLRAVAASVVMVALWPSIRLFEVWAWWARAATTDAAVSHPRPAG
jgi:hypothetical protein